jgi:hypothetical protein
MRPSTETQIETGISYVVILLVGAAMMFGGGWLVVAEYRTPPQHTTHIAIGAGFFLFGALVLLIGLAKKQGTTILQTIIVNVSPFVPKFGGKRAGDPPMPEDEIPPPAITEPQP